MARRVLRVPSTWNEVAFQLNAIPIASKMHMQLMQTGAWQDIYPADWLVDKTQTLRPAMPVQGSLIFDNPRGGLFFFGSRPRATWIEITVSDSTGTTYRHSIPFEVGPPPSILSVPDGRGGRIPIP